MPILPLWDHVGVTNLWGCVFRFSYFLNVALIKNIHQNMR